MIRLIIWCKPFAKYLLAAWIIAVIIVSSIPHLPTLKIHTAKSDIRLDYLIHFCEYGIMAFMAFLSFSGREFEMNYKKWIFLTLGLILFAFLDELHQKLIPGRSYNIKDILSNISGILAVLIFCIVVFRMIIRREYQH
jgi:VanZ family protein